jgi:hypothetical protein
MPRRDSHGHGHVRVRAWRSHSIVDDAAVAVWPSDSPYRRGTAWRDLARPNRIEYRLGINNVAGEQHPQDEVGVSGNGVGRSVVGIDLVKSRPRHLGTIRALLRSVNYSERTWGSRAISPNIVSFRHVRWQRADACRARSF